MLYTRQDYVSKVCSHHDYYKQFVTRAISSAVESSNLDLSSPLKKWDELAGGVSLPTGLLRDTGEAVTGMPSLCAKVCTLKTAYRMIYPFPLSEAGLDACQQHNLDPKDTKEYESLSQLLIHSTNSRQKAALSKYFTLNCPKNKTFAQNLEAEIASSDKLVNLLCLLEGVDSEGYFGEPFDAERYSKTRIGTFIYC